MSSKAKTHAEIYIGCADGTVLHVRPEADSGWVYTIAGPNRNTVATVYYGTRDATRWTFEHARDAAYRDAALHGGWNWVCSGDRGGA